ncbi:Cutinase transcription factor 1 beta [Colletotrichum trifolii]|uniref:Cutinase transcription factor 1 beta n=1 Tax=Colletotrichum trifolii TaxID=5466 RepID=A0A4V3HU91_COLTR|nr:Cutinase transcription factor 1 beta [Colletotrichum trifolii]
MASEATVPETTTRPKVQSKQRKRAPKACLSCRARKVRCDVSQRGRPCMNCYLDSETCVVTSRASRFRKAPQRDGTENGQDAGTIHPPCAPETSEDVHDTDPMVPTSVESQPSSSTAAGGQRQGHAHSHSSHSPSSSEGNDRQTSPAAHRNGCLDDHVGQDQPAKPFSTTTATFEPFAPSSLPVNGQLPPAQWSGDPRRSLGLDITFSFYPFLALGNLHNIPPQDVNFLELQGCLRIPTRAILDEFVQQYFLHVHPLLPMLNEGDFWDVYCANPATFPHERVSLLLFQAMLFASCNFVSRQTIKALGFSTIRAARAAFYRRAKLLYDLESESSPLAVSQAALLLSFRSPPTTPSLRRSNTAWLAIAIQNARTAEAHRYASRSAPDGRRNNLLKRLWWCCVVRDRIVGLGMRRGVQITRDHFDFDSNGLLGCADLAGEVERSRVYNPGTKRCLAEILAQLVELCVVLTDILILVFPLDDSPGWGREMRAEEQDSVRGCKVALQRWYKGATMRFPMFGGGSVARVRSPGNEFQHDSVILYTNLMYMYYHSSRVVLSHHEVLHLAITAAAPSFSAIPTSDLVVIGENRHELQDAASGVTECLKELIHLRLARWLPISAVTCTALPLVLHILDVKLAASSRSFDPNTQSALKQHRLNILIEAMKTYQPQYDGVDWVSETIRHIVNLAQLDSPPGDTGSPSEGGAVIADWTDILASQPSSYLRLALTMDLSLSKGRLPEDGDFPVSLRGLFTGGFNPLKALLERKRDESKSATGEPVGGPGASMRELPHGAMKPNAYQMEPGTVATVPSDGDTNSPSSAGGHSQDSGYDDTPLRNGGNDDVNMTDRPPSEGIDGLAAEVLAAFPMDDQAPASVDGDFDGMYFDGMPGHDGPNGWIENAWSDIHAGDDKSDRDTARVLLEVLSEGALAECAA